MSIEPVPAHVWKCVTILTISKLPLPRMGDAGTIRADICRYRGM